MEYNVSNADRLGECARSSRLVLSQGLFIGKVPGIPSYLRTKDVFGSKSIKIPTERVRQDKHAWQQNLILTGKSVLCYSHKG